MMFTLKENKPANYFYMTNYYLDDTIIGRTTSETILFVMKNLSFGYKIEIYETFKDKNIFIEVEKKKYPVDILQKPLNQKDYKN